MRGRWIVKRIAALLSAAAAASLLAWLFAGGGANGTAGPAEGGPAAAAEAGAAAGTAAVAKPATGTPAPEAELPDDNRFVPAGESAELELWADPATGHFKVVRKATGTAWYSYPDPAFWPNEKLSGTWRSHILSPIMLESVDLSNSKSQSRTVNWYDDGGTLDDFAVRGDGFTATYTFTNSGFRVPVRVKLDGAHVETSIGDSRLEENGQLSLLNLKLYPLLGAEPYTEQEEGYLLLPDGSGALVRFKPNLTGDKSVYRESVYGQDAAFFVEGTDRAVVRMPVFGIKSGDRSVLGILTAGGEYAKVFAVPGGVYGESNWITPEWQYRVKFFQNTNRNGSEGFFTYNKERFESPARSVRYSFLEGGDGGYPGMAAEYRAYLTGELGVQPAVRTDGAAGTALPFYLDLIGGDARQGLLADDYLTATTTAQAAEIVRALHDAGVGPLSVTYLGWQRGGYSSYGGLLPVESKLGGNEGMASFIREAHGLGAEVWLGANYEWNSNGRGGFWPRSDGLRNLAGTVQQFRPGSERDEITVVSPAFAAEALKKDLQAYKALGADGIVFEGGFGSALNSDFNRKTPLDRSEALQLHRDALRLARETLGGAGVTDGSFYALGEATRYMKLTDDYSYDLFVDEAVPFAQIALHGLVPYTSQWSNLRDEYRTEFLRSVEYGASPSFIFTASPSDKLKRSYSVWYYSTDYRDWLDTAVKEYARYNEALGDVQDQAIAGHRTVAPGVKETTYEGGKRIVVNYNDRAYAEGGIEVPPLDFVVLEGGAGA